MRINGTRGDDYLWGTDLADRIFAGAGNDFAAGGQGDDLVAGGDGNDKLFGDAGDDVVRGGLGDDQLWDWQGEDFLFGGLGRDQLHGDAIDYQRDTIHGGPGSDALYGGTGFDRLIGGDGDDIISGMGGEYYGDREPGINQRFGFGNDGLASDLAYDFGTPRIMTGGKGADSFWLAANPEGVATPVVITDYVNGEDHLVFSQHDPWGLRDMVINLDGNRDGQLDASDGWLGGVGNVRANENSLVLTVGDGDSLTFLGITHLDYVI